MIDSHVHLLPGVDDGAKDFAHALEMLERSKLDGVTHWVVTPHFNHACSAYSYEALKEKFLQWRMTLPQNSTLYNIIFGVEVYVDEPFVNDISTMHPLPTFENSNYMLIEFNRNTNFEMIHAVIHELKLRNVVPILAHVEVYKVLVDHPEYVKSIADEGALVQVSAKSIKDKRYQTFVKKLIQLNAIDLVASDGHNLHDRKPFLSEAYNHVAKTHSKVWADRLFIESPQIVYSGRGYLRPITIKTPKKRHYAIMAVTVMVAIALILAGVSQLGLNKKGSAFAILATSNATQESMVSETTMMTEATIMTEATETVDMTATTVTIETVDRTETVDTSEKNTVVTTTEDVMPTTPTYDAIESRYVSQLQSLQNQYTSDVQRIYNAIQDTRNFVTDEAKRKEIINAYLEEAGSLEAICDGNVYDLLYDFQNELEAHAYEVAIIEIIRADYHRIKEETKNEYANNF